MDETTFEFDGSSLDYGEIYKRVGGILRKWLELVEFDYDSDSLHLKKFERIGYKKVNLSYYTARSTKTQKGAVRFLCTVW